MWTTRSSDSGILIELDRKYQPTEKTPPLKAQIESKCLSQTDDLLASLIVLLAWHNSSLFVEEGSFSHFLSQCFLLTHREKLENIGCIFLLPILHTCDAQGRKTNTSNGNCRMNFRMRATDFSVHSAVRLLIRSKNLCEVLCYELEIQGERYTNPLS